MHNYSVRFTYNNRKYTVNFICSYGGALSRSGKPAADYAINGMFGDSTSLRFSTDDNLRKHGIERTALAAYKRENNRDVASWCRDYGYKNRGAVWRFHSQTRRTAETRS